MNYYASSSSDRGGHSNGSYNDRPSQGGGGPYDRDRGRYDDNDRGERNGPRPYPGSSDLRSQWPSSHKRKEDSNGRGGGSSYIGRGSSSYGGSGSKRGGDWNKGKGKGKEGSSPLKESFARPPANFISKRNRASSYTSESSADLPLRNRHRSTSPRRTMDSPPLRPDSSSAMDVDPAIQGIQNDTGPQAPVLSLSRPQGPSLPGALDEDGEELKFATLSRAFNSSADAAKDLDRAEQTNGELIGMLQGAGQDERMEIQSLLDGTKAELLEAKRRHIQAAQQLMVAFKACSSSGSPPGGSADALKLDSLEQNVKAMAEEVKRLDVEPPAVTPASSSLSQLPHFTEDAVRERSSRTKARFDSTDDAIAKVDSRVAALEGQLSNNTEMIYELLDLGNMEEGANRRSEMEMRFKQAEKAIAALQRYRDRQLEESEASAAQLGPKDDAFGAVERMQAQVEGLTKTLESVKRQGEADRQAFQAEMLQMRQQYAADLELARARLDLMERGNRAQQGSLDILQEAVSDVANTNAALKEELSGLPRGDQLRAQWTADATRILHGATATTASAVSEDLPRAAQGSPRSPAAGKSLQQLRAPGSPATRPASSSLASRMTNSTSTSLQSRLGGITSPSSDGK